MNWEDLLNKKVSILMDGLKGKEAYTGRVESIDDEWLVLDQSTKGAKIDKTYIKIKLVLSILRYVEEWRTEK